MAEVRALDHLDDDQIVAVLDSRLPTIDPIAIRLCLLLLIALGIVLLVRARRIAAEQNRLVDEDR